MRGLMSFLMSFFCLGKSSAESIKTTEEKAAYTIGRNIGESLKHQDKDINLKVLIEGLNDGFAGVKPKISSEEGEKAYHSWKEKIQNKLSAQKKEDASKQGKEGQDFLEKNKKQPGVIVTASGLQYKVLKQGTGEKPGPTDLVRVHYEGKLLDGKVFDSSYSRGTPAEFRLNQVIKGWQEGLQLMNPSSKYEFFIPYNLAYGASGAGASIPPYATLIFTVELLKVVK